MVFNGFYIHYESIILFAVGKLRCNNIVGKMFYHFNFNFLENGVIKINIMQFKIINPYTNQHVHLHSDPEIIVFHYTIKQFIMLKTMFYGTLPHITSF